MTNWLGNAGVYAIRIVSAGYPLCFERGESKGTPVIAIDPSDKKYSFSSAPARPLLTQNTEYTDGTLKMKGISLFIGEW
ncbi:MAG: hypothetical protein J6V07_03365 [Clostridia bacterium]|nr:hypothetical protein [Clostridia bacterium]